MFAPMKHLLWPKSFTKQLWKGVDYEISFKRTELKIIKRTSNIKTCWEPQKKSYYSNLDIKNVTDKRPLKGEKTNLIENDKNISNDTEFCDIFNGFFSNIISELNNVSMFSEWYGFRFNSLCPQRI